VKRILCLSGGGVRGIAQVQVLKVLEEQYRKPLCEVYDLIIGTSAGAINASVIATGKISMRDLSNMYEDLMKKIFKKRFGIFPIPKYDRKIFENEWAKIIGDFLFSEAKTKLIITTVDLVSDTNIFYKSWHENHNDTQLKDIVLRSFAAPLYFGQIADKKNKMVYSDGGLGSANFPLMEAKLQAEAFGWYHDGEEVEIHAVGALFDDKKQSFDEVSHDSWIQQILDFLKPSDGGLARLQSRVDQLRMMEYICSKIPTIKFKYWDSHIENTKLSLDDIQYCGYYRYLGSLMAQDPLIQYNY